MTRDGVKDWTGVRDDALIATRREPHPAPGPPALHEWRPTESLTRALLVGATTAVVAVASGRPDLWVLGAPLLVAGLAAASRRPPAGPTRVLPAVLRTGRIPEGWSTLVVSTIERLLGAEQITRAHDDVAFVDTIPGSTARAVSVAPGTEDHELVSTLAVRRWGVREVGAGSVAATSPWSGWRWGPVRVPGSNLTVLPGTAAYGSRGQAPQPVGLVGAHRSAQVGEGNEFTGIRPFVAGDRLRRINWRVSLASGELHVVQTRADQDAAVLLLVDATADVGRSGGVGGAASSLDLTVRAAAALAEHHLGIGDRVGLRVIGSAEPPVGFGVGARHRARLLHTLARAGRARSEHIATDPGGRLRLQPPAGTVVLVLSPMLDPTVAAISATIARSRLPMVVVDTLPESVEHRGANAPDRAVAASAWAVRLLEREQLLDEISRSGVAVVRWRGPGTLDGVLRRLARRARLPRLVMR